MYVSRPPLARTDRASEPKLCRVRVQEPNPGNGVGLGIPFQEGVEPLVQHRRVASRVGLCDVVW